jgi:type II secretory pathway pseudopilin PulG
MGEKGFTLIDTLVALALLGITALVFLGGISIMFKGSTVADKHVAAESLAKSQWESIKAQNYIETAEYSEPGNSYQLIEIPGDLAGQDYEIIIEPPQAVINPGGGGGYECQSLTVIVRHEDEEVIRITDYKAGRI